MDKRRILLVDDEFNLVEMIKLRLEAAGYEVLTAFDGQTAYDIARKEKPDLIVLDVMLPKMDGYKVCGLLKKDAKYSKIPILMFTAKAQEEDKQLGKDLGADGYLSKPFEPQVLMNKIAEHMKG